MTPAAIAAEHVAWARHVAGQSPESLLLGLGHRRCEAVAATWAIVEDVLAMMAGEMHCGERL